MQANLVQELTVTGDQLLGTTFDDDAEFPLTDGTTPFAGTFKPVGDLSAFNTKDPQGIWRLEIRDSGDDPARPTLAGWSLELITIDSRDDRVVRPATTRTITATAKTLGPPVDEATAELRKNS